MACEWGLLTTCWPGWPRGHEKPGLHRHWINSHVPCARSTCSVTKSAYLSHICRFNIRSPFSVAPSRSRNRKTIPDASLSADSKWQKEVGRPGHNCNASSSCRMRRQPLHQCKGWARKHQLQGPGRMSFLLILGTEGWPKRNKTPQESRPKQPQPLQPRSVELLEHHQCHQQWNTDPQRSLGWVVGGFQKRDILTPTTKGSITPKTNVYIPYTRTNHI